MNDPSIAARPSPFGFGRSGAAFLVIGLAAIAAYGLAGSGPVGDLVFMAICGAASAAVILSAKRNRVLVPRAWLAVGAALALLAVADLLTAIGRIPSLEPLRWGAQLLFLVAYVPLFVAAVRFGRPTRSSDRTALLDTGILGLAIAPIVWEWLIEPSIPGAITGPEAMAALALPGVDIILVSLVLPLIVMRYSRSVSGMLFVAGLAMMAVGDATYAARSLAGVWSGNDLVNVSWLTSYVLLGTAALVPSGRALGAISDPRSGSRDAGRTLLVSLALLVSPIVGIYEVLADDAVDLLLLGGLEVATASLVVLRLNKTIGELTDADLRFRRFMGHEGFVAAIKDATGRYLFMNSTAETIRGVGGLDWYGRTDAELTSDTATGDKLGGGLTAGRASGALDTVEHGGRVWHTERFVLPGSPGGIGMLGVEITDRIHADRRARERALIAETLGALDAGRTPEATADAVCRQLLKLPEFRLTAVLTFGADGIGTMLGQADREGLVMPALPLTRERSDYLRARALAGPWVERWTGGSDHPYHEVLARMGAVGHAYAPIIADDVLLGILIAGSTASDGIEQLTERLPALVEFASITRALLATQFNDRIATATARAEIQAMVEAGAFRPAYQPIVELANGDIRGYEALTRFADGTPPDLHFERAHELGLGLELERACLEAAVASATSLPSGTWLNVNVSPEMIESGTVEALIPAGEREIVLEITEHQAITDYDTFRAAVAPIRDRIRLAVDDAGAGYASLRHIVELAPTFVKLDRTLIAGIDADGARQAVIAGMVRFAQTAGLVLIAEGIETVGELAALRRLGVRLGQGFLLGRPAFAMPSTSVAMRDTARRACRAADGARPIRRASRRAAPVALAAPVVSRA